MIEWLSITGAIIFRAYESYVTSYKRSGNKVDIKDIIKVFFSIG